MTRVRAVLTALLLGVLAVTLVACSGVPSSSSPEVVRTLPVGGEEEPSQTVTPATGIGPQSLVQGFLEQNASSAGRHASARTFLSPAARSSWSDTTTTTVLSSLTVGAYTAGKPVVVTGQEVGSVSNTGVYTPSLQGRSTSAVQFVFGITRVDGQYRIGTLRSGLVLTEAQFQDSYDQRNVYFFDLAHRFLVPDLRWVPKTDPITEAETLVNFLAGGPSSGIQNAVSSDTLPPQPNTPRHIDVTSGSVLRIDVAGASQLDTTTRDRLAAQIAATLSDVERGRALQMTDSGSPVRIPDAGGTVFSASDFGDSEVVPPPGEVYYVRNGRVVAGNRRALGGAVNNGRYLLSSVAASRSGPGGALSLAGIAYLDGTNKLLVGSQSGGLRPVAVTGTTSRPAFAPDRVEAWVGAGSRLYRVTFGSSAAPTVSSVGLPTTVAGQKILAVRLSPEGSRIAVVLESAGGARRLYTGAIVRTGAQVRVDTVSQISPDSAQITDVAWVETQRLYAIGYDQATSDAHIYQTGADGSAWSAAGIGGLPAAPTTLTVAQSEPAWVTAQSSVYVQAGGTTWVSPGSGSPAAGGAPVYLE